MISRIRTYLTAPVSIAPLAILRIAFGALMLASTIRFIAKGWVYDMYIAPKVFFPFFDWVKPLPGDWMYVVFAMMAVAAACIMLGAFYRVSAIVFFTLFSYVELIDKTNYLNHYYFISLVAFLMIFVPAGSVFSIDHRISGKRDRAFTARWTILIFQLQLAIVYFFAGVAKINSDWLLEAQPLRIWLPAFTHYPVIGPFMEQAWVAYLFSWFGCIYDLSIAFLLFNRRTVNIAYVFVVVFHFATAAFFNIGMFPYIMVVITVIFFRENFHLRLLGILKSCVGYRAMTAVWEPVRHTGMAALLMAFFVVQLVLPLRHHFYDGDLFWTEQGYRFSWRVMLMEKAGTAFFYVTDAASGRSSEVDNKQHLTFMQEKMMSTQPDMMVDYACYLRKYFEAAGYRDPEVRVMSYVTLNGSGSREFVDPELNLAASPEKLLACRNWIRSYPR